MKKILSVLIAAVFLTIAFSGCGGAETVKNVPVKEIMTKVVGNTDLDAKMVDVSDSQISETYHIDLSMLEEYSVKISNNIVSANTIAVFKLKDVKDIETFQNGINTRKADLIKIFQDYAPAEADLAKNGVELTKGKYIIFVVSKDAEKVKSAFVEMLK